MQRLASPEYTHFPRSGAVGTAAKFCKTRSTLVQPPSNPLRLSTTPAPELDDWDGDRPLTAEEQRVQAAALKQFADDSVDLEARDQSNIRSVRNPLVKGRSSSPGACLYLPTPLRTHGSLASRLTLLPPSPLRTGPQGAAGP